MIKCFDVVNMVVEEATNRFAPIWKINEEHYNVLQSYCDIIDSIARFNDAESFDVEVSEVDMTIKIVIESPDLVSDENDSFTELIRHTVGFGFSASEEGLLRTKLVFPSIWQHV